LIRARSAGSQENPAEARRGSQRIGDTATLNAPRYAILLRIALTASRFGRPAVPAGRTSLRFGKRADQPLRFSPNF